MYTFSNFNIVVLRTHSKLYPQAGIKIWTLILRFVNSCFSGDNRIRTDASCSSGKRAHYQPTQYPHLSSRWDSNSHYPGSRPGNLNPIGLLLVVFQITCSLCRTWTCVSAVFVPMPFPLDEQRVLQFISVTDNAGTGWRNRTDIGCLKDTPPKPLAD